MNELVIRTSRPRAIAATLGSLAFVAVGLFFLYEGKDQGASVIAILTLLGFGFFSLAGLYVILRNPPRLVIRETGITDRSKGIGEVAWEDIESIEIWTGDRKPQIELYIGSTEKYLKKMSEKLNPLYSLDGDLERGILVIDTHTFDVSPEKIYEAIRKRLLRHRESETLQR